MQVILVTDVKSLGKKGTIVNVNDSYARNYIIPRGLGVEANKANLNDLKLQNANMEKLEAARVSNARAMKQAIDGRVVTVEAKAGKDGRLFGAVTSKEIAEAVEKAYGVSVDRKKIVSDPIKAVGDYPVTFKLHKEIQAAMTVRVAAV